MKWNPSFAAGTIVSIAVVFSCMVVSITLYFSGRKLLAKVVWIDPDIPDVANLAHVEVDIRTTRIETTVDVFGKIFNDLSSRSVLSYSFSAPCVTDNGAPFGLRLMLMSSNETRWFVFMASSVIVNATNLYRWLRVMDAVYDPLTHLVMKTAIGYTEIEAMVVVSRAMLKLQIDRNLTCLDSSPRVSVLMAGRDILGNDTAAWGDPFILGAKCGNCDAEKWRVCTANGYQVHDIVSHHMLLPNDAVRYSFSESAVHICKGGKINRYSARSTLTASGVETAENAHFSITPTEKCREWCVVSSA